MEIAKSFRRITSFLAGAIVISAPFAALAQTYGAGTYGSGAYGAATSGNSGGGTSGGGTNLNLGPVSLPITGPGAWATWGTVALILAALLFYWALTHRKKRRAQSVKHEEF